MKKTSRRFGFRSMSYALLAAIACLRGGTSKRDATRRMAGHIRQLMKNDRVMAKARARFIIAKASNIVAAASFEKTAHRLDTSPASNRRRRAEMRELFTPTGTQRSINDRIAS